MSVINTNVSATLTSNALAKNDRAMSQSMERLSTGQRINSASDDAAGLAIASKMTSQIRGLDQAVRNGNDAISMIQTADGAMVEVTNMLQRMREVTVQAASGTNTTDDLAALNIEFKALGAQIDEIAKNTEWNGMKMLDGSAGSITFQVGAGASQTISVEFADLNTNFGDPTANSGADQATKAGKTANAADDLDIFTNLSTANASTDSVTGDGVLEAVDLDSLVITGSAHATTLGYLDTALDRINSHRATLGATVNRLEYAVDNLANVSQNASASRSRVQDANYATESTELARTQIIQQAGTAMLAQANQQSQSVLALLK
ncbi:flagellin [Porticoccaceae bacterium]|nr:flagellin [Porticoccaceae bacterium]